MLTLFLTCSVTFAQRRRQLRASIARFSWPPGYRLILNKQTVTESCVDEHEICSVQSNDVTRRDARYWAMLCVRSGMASVLRWHLLEKRLLDTGLPTGEDRQDLSIKDAGRSSD